MATKPIPNAAPKAVASKPSKGAQQLINRFDSVNSGPIVPKAVTPDSTIVPPVTPPVIPPVTPPVTPPVIPPAGGRTVQSTVQNSDGTITVIYTDGTTNTVGTANKTTPDSSAMSYLMDGLKGLGGGMDAAIANAWQLFKDGFTSDYIMNDPTKGFRNSQAYQARFPGMKALNSAGQGVSEAQYLQKEDNDRQLLYKYLGAGASAYDNPAKLGSFITGYKSTQVLEQNLQAVHDAVNSSPETKAYLQSNYGLSPQDLALHWLDPAVSTDQINKQLTASEIGGDAAKAGFGTLSQTSAEGLATQGVTNAQAQSVFGRIGGDGQLMQALPGNDSGSISQQDLIDASFTGGAPAQKLAALQASRVGQFQAGGGMAADSSGVIGDRSANTQ